MALQEECKVYKTRKHKKYTIKFSFILKLLLLKYIAIEVTANLLMTKEQIHSSILYNI